MSDLNGMSSLIEQLKELNQQETIGLISTFPLQPENSEKQTMIEFALRLALSHCAGTKKPTLEEIHTFVQSVGEWYKNYRSKQKQSLEIIFSNRALFSNCVEGNLDQTIDYLWKRFQKHDKFLENKLGFNVANAIFFAKTITSTITARMSKITPTEKKRLYKSQYYNFSYFVKPSEKIVGKWCTAIRFKKGEIEALFPPHLRAKIEKYIVFASTDSKEIPVIYHPLEDNYLWRKPILRYDTEYVIPLPYYLLHGLTSQLENTIYDDAEYQGKYGNDKGHVLEEWANEELRLIFRSGKLFRGVKYQSAGSEPDADIIVSYGEYLIFVECTTHGISQSSRQGNRESIENTLASSVKKCYKQALRAKQAFLEGRLKLDLDNKPSKLIPMIVTDTLYPNLLSEFTLAKHFNAESYLGSLIKDKEYPYIISIYDLQSIRCITNERTFVQFLNERLSMYEKPFFLAYDELDYYILFSKKEYQNFKEQIIQRQITYSYVAHLPSPAVKPITFHFFMDIIGADEFAVIKLGNKYDRSLASIAFAMLYDIYCDWDKIMEHLVFDLKGFNSVLKRYNDNGNKCRCIIWEGFEEYFKYNPSRNKKDYFEFMRKLNKNDIGYSLNILIAMPTDVYEQLWKDILNENRIPKNTELGHS